MSVYGLSWNSGSPDESVMSAYYARLDETHAKANTIASAIEINRPVNLKKCLRALDFCQGVVRSVSDQEIMDANVRIGSGGFGCEPASGKRSGSETIARRRRDCAFGSGGMRADGPSAQGSDGDGCVSQRRSGAVRQGAWESRRPARDSPIAQSSWRTISMTSSA